MCLLVFAMMFFDVLPGAASVTSFQNQPEFGANGTGRHGYKSARFVEFRPILANAVSDCFVLRLSQNARAQPRVGETTICANIGLGVTPFLACGAIHCFESVKRNTGHSFSGHNRNGDDGKQEIFGKHCRLLKVHR